MAEDIFTVMVPQLGVNDEEATLVAWHVSDEEFVSVEALLYTLETTKSVADVPAELEGYVLRLVEIGNEVKVGQPVALIGPTLESLQAEKRRRNAQNGHQGGPEEVDRTPPKATRKAALLAEELGIDLADIGGNGIIREEDVQRFAAQRSQETGAKALASPEKWVKPPDPDEAGYLNPEFLSKIAQDPTFAQLSSELKIYLYRANGGQIGENVKLGSGSIILSRVIRLADEVEIGPDSYIKTDRFVLGRMSVIGSRARIVTREVVIGDVLFSGEDIVIGGGGGFGPRSSLRVGNNCLISNNCVLNTGEPITIGDEVGLSPKVQLYTHSYWQNVLQGYTARHAPIVVESEAYITGGCLVAPGVRIGQGSTVLANSVVAANVEPHTIVSGVPAKLVAQVNTNLTQAQKEHMVQRLMAEMADTLHFQGFEPEKVAYLPTYDCQSVAPAEVILTFKAVNLPDTFEQPVIFDLTSFQVYGTQTRLSDEVRNFLRRRGVRFKPIYWRYTHDKGFFIQ